MKDLLNELLIAVITAAIPVLAGFLISFINKVKENAAANTDDVKKQGYIAEISAAVTDAVAATSQTFVDGLKKAGAFDGEAQREAAKMALDICVSSLSASAVSFIETVYGDLGEYLVSRIEAEVRRQKIEISVTGGMAG